MKAIVPSHLYGPSVDLLPDGEDPFLTSEVLQVSISQELLKMPRSRNVIVEAGRDTGHLAVTGLNCHALESELRVCSRASSNSGAIIRVTDISFLAARRLTRRARGQQFRFSRRRRQDPQHKGDQSPEVFSTLIAESVRND